MKIFNKCLKKEINTNFLLNNLNITSKKLNNLSLLSKAFARNIQRPNSKEGEAEKAFENKIENKDFQAPPKIKIENNTNKFEDSFASQSFDGDKAFSKDREFKQKNYQEKNNSAELGESQNPKGNRRESYGERDNRGFKGDRDFKNRRFDDSGNFREKRNFDQGFNFESKNLYHHMRINTINHLLNLQYWIIKLIFIFNFTLIKEKERSFGGEENEFRGERKFERRRFDSDSNFSSLLFS